MKVSYHPDTDSTFIKLKPGVEAEGAEVVPASCSITRPRARSRP